MRIICYPKSALLRQATEAHQINLNATNNVLNRWGEWWHNISPKLVEEGREVEKEKDKVFIRGRRILQKQEKKNRRYQRSKRSPWR